MYRIEFHHSHSITAENTVGSGSDGAEGVMVAWCWCGVDASPQAAASAIDHFVGNWFGYSRVNIRSICNMRFLYR
jgi:hypothetical protein